MTDSYIEKHWAKNVDFTLADDEVEAYEKRLVECCDVLKQAYKDHISGNHEGWEKNIEEKQADGTVITLHQKPTEAGLSYTKVTSVVNCTAQEALDWSTNIENSGKYDEYYDKSEFFVNLTDKVYPNGKHDRLRAYALARSQIKGHSFVLKAREFVHLLGKEQLDEKFGNIAIAPMTSVECKHIPERDTHVRGFIDNQGSVFIPNEDGTCTVINVTHVNMNGWMPDWVMNLITNDVSQTKRMREELHKDMAKVQD